MSFVENSTMESQEEVQTITTNACVRDLLIHAAQYRHQADINNNDGHLHQERLCLEQAATHLLEESSDMTMDISACFVVHARLAHLYHQLALSSVEERPSLTTTPPSDTDPPTTNIWQKRVDEAAAVAVKMYIKVFDGRTQYRKDGPYQRLNKFLNALLVQGKRPQEKQSVADASSVAKVVYTKRLLKDVRNGLRMGGALETTPSEMIPYRDVTDVACYDSDGEECDAEENKDKCVTPGVHILTSKERRKQLRMEKFAQQSAEKK
jgi:hypothetical protein